MSEERNESLEILTCIREHGPIAAEDISTRTGYNRHLVDVAINLMIEHNLIHQSGMGSVNRPPEWQDPVYRIKDSAIANEGVILE